MDKKDLYKKLGIKEDPAPAGGRSALGSEIFSRIERTISASAHDGKPPAVKKKVPVAKISWYWAAAVLLIAAAGTFWILNTSRSRDIVVSTAAGATRKIELPDGSLVWLNAASKLRYPAEFQREREVYLEEGEAFFQVKRDTASPFSRKKN